MRDRLIELIKQGQPEYNPLNDSCISNLADHLIANGVILLPCKVGDKIYQLDTAGNIYESKITQIKNPTSLLRYFSMERSAKNL